MSGILLGSVFLAFIYLVYWARKNDSIPPDRPTTGFFRMSFYDKTAKGATPVPPAADRSAGPPDVTATESRQP